MTFKIGDKVRDVMTKEIGMIIELPTNVPMMTIEWYFPGSNPEIDEPYSLRDVAFDDVELVTE